MDDANESQIRQLQQIQEMKPRKGAIILVFPILMVIAVFTLWIGMIGLGLQGRAADGERVELTWQGCPEAGPVLEKRVASMGLGEPELHTEGDQLRLTVTLPDEPDVAARIPTTLGMRGVLSSHAEGSDEVLFTNADVTGAAIRQDITLSPWVVLTLTEAAQERLQAHVLAHRDGRIRYTLDGQPLGSTSNLDGAPREVELLPDGTDERDRMHRAAEQVIVLDAPLPCDLVPVGSP